LLISDLLVNLDTPSESSIDGEFVGKQKKKCTYVTLHCLWLAIMTIFSLKNKSRVDATDEDSIFSDIEVTGISSESRAQCEGASCDIQEFFDNTYATMDTDGKVKQY
jgi:hypothetical protein